MSVSARRWLPAAGFQFLFIAAVALAKPAANAAVVARLGAAAMPWLYVGAAVITGALAFRSTSPGVRPWAPGPLSVIGAGVTLALAVALEFGGPVAAVLAWLFAEAFATQLALTFWAELGEVFDPREAKSAFPRINGLGMTGAILGGVGAQLVSGPRTAIFLMAISGALLLAAALVHRGLPKVAVRARDRVDSAWGHVFFDPYARGLAVVVLGLAVLGVLADFVFRARAGVALKESELASLFAWAQAGTGALCVLLQVFFAGALLRRVGIVRYLSLVPFLLALGAIACALVPGLEAAFVLKLVEGAASLSILPVGFQLLYAPLPDDLRHGIRQVIDGFLRKGGLAVAGLVLLAVRDIGAGPWPPLLVIALAGLSLWRLQRIEPRYVGALEGRVAGSRVALPTDEASLVQALGAASPERVLRAVDLLEAIGEPIEAHVPKLLRHAHERVQERGIQLARELAVAPAAGLLEAIAKKPEGRARLEASWALAELAPRRAREVLPPLLDSDDPAVRCAAVGALVSLGSELAPRQAIDALTSLVATLPSAEPGWRLEVARMIGRLRNNALAPALSGCLDDHDPQVRRAALQAVGDGKYLELAPRLIRFLGFRDDRRTAREALAAFGDDAVPLLAQALDDRSRSLALRLQLPRVLRQVETPNAFAALLASNAHDDPSLHYRVGAALARLRDELPAELEIDRTQVLGAIARRVAMHERQAHADRALEGRLPYNHVLRRAVRDRLEQAREIAFWLFGLLHDMRLMRRTHAQLWGGDPRQRAYALELLEHTLRDDERRLAEPFVEPRSHDLGTRAAADQEIRALAQSTDDRTLRAVARLVARQAGFPDEFPEDDVSQETVQRLFALEGVEIFARTDVDDLLALAAVARERNFAKGDVVFQQGDPGDSLYVILQGKVEAVREGELVMVLGEREVFGDVSLVDGSPRVTDMIAKEDLATLVIDRRDFLDLVADRPELLGGVLSALSRQLKTMVVDLSHARRANTGETLLPPDA